MPTNKPNPPQSSRTFPKPTDDLIDELRKRAKRRQARKRFKRQTEEGRVLRKTFDELETALFDIGQQFEEAQSLAVEKGKDFSKANKEAFQAIVRFREKADKQIQSISSMLSKRGSDRWPTETMLKNAKIKARWKDKEEDFEFQCLIKLLNYLWQHRIRYEYDCIALAKRIRTGMFWKKGKAFNFAFVGRLDFKKMVKELGMSRSLIRYYMEKLARLGFLKKFKKDGPHGQMVFAIGYQSPRGKNRFGEDIFKAEPFLISNKDFITKLGNFTMPYKLFERGKTGEKGKSQN